MNPELGKGWFSVALFITLTAACLLVYQRPGTAEYIITVASLIIGLVFIALIVIIVRRAH